MGMAEETFSPTYDGEWMTKPEGVQGVGANVGGSQGARGFNVGVPVRRGKEECGAARASDPGECTWRLVDLGLTTYGSGM